MPISQGVAHGAEDFRGLLEPGAIRAVFQPIVRLSDLERSATREFALVFACGGAAEAEQVGWQLRTQARERLGSTVSVGLALAEPDEPDEGIVARADAALYEVKRRGRDSVIVAPPRAA